MRHFTGNILNYASWEDIEQNEWLDMDKDRGRIRRNRVYRRLVMAPVVYNEGVDDPDYLYIKNQRNILQKDAERYLEASLHIHKNGAVIVVPTGNAYQDTFPGYKGISDVVLLLNYIIHEKIKGNELTPDERDIIRISQSYFESLIDDTKKRYGSGWSKEYREMKRDRLYLEVTEFMEDFDLVRRDFMNRELIIMPLTGKVMGVYPKDYEGLPIQEEENHE